MRAHVMAVGIVYTSLGGFWTLLWTFMLIGVVFAGFDAVGDPRDAVARELASFVDLGFTALSAATLAGGIGLLLKRPWARRLLLWVSALHPPLLPFGTGVGIYAFWVLRRPEARQLLGVSAPQGEAAELAQSTRSA